MRCPRPTLAQAPSRAPHCCRQPGLAAFGVSVELGGPLVAFSRAWTTWRAREGLPQHEAGSNPSFPLAAAARGLQAAQGTSWQEGIALQAAARAWLRGSRGGDGRPEGCRPPPCPNARRRSPCLHSAVGSRRNPEWLIFTQTHAHTHTHGIVCSACLWVWFTPSVLWHSSPSSNNCGIAVGAGAKNAVGEGEKRGRHEMPVLILGGICNKISVLR